MPTKAKTTSGRRAALTRERILSAAVASADASGIAQLSMRKLGESLGVEAMSLYNHVANKDALLDAMVDSVFAEIELPSPQDDWKEAMGQRAWSTRRALSRHPWAVALMQSRIGPGPATLRHHDAVIGSLLDAGFSMDMTAHAFALIDNYIYGFAQQEASLPFQAGEVTPEIAATFMEQLSASEYPRLRQFSVEHVLQPGYDFGAEFEFGLNLVLDGLERARSSSSSSPTTD